MGENRLLFFVFFWLIIFIKFIQSSNFTTNQSPTFNETTTPTTSIPTSKATTNKSSSTSKTTTSTTSSSTSKTTTTTSSSTSKTTTSTTSSSTSKATHSTTSSSTSKATSSTTSSSTSKATTSTTSSSTSKATTPTTTSPTSTKSRSTTFTPTSTKPTPTIFFFTKNENSTTHNESVTSPNNTNTNGLKDTVSDRNVKIIVGVLVGLAVLLALLIISIKMKFYEKCLKKGLDSSNSHNINKPIQALKFNQVLAEMNANSQMKFAEEFELLKGVGSYQTKDVASYEANVTKNRYSNIRPYDLTRVKISPNPDDESDYINASWIPGYFSRRQYIAAQGPLASTQDDFWRMIWEYNVKTIVMLTKLIEDNTIKCHQYWPMDDGMIMYGDIRVTLISTKITDHWVVRELLLNLGQQRRTLKHCAFTSWPDMKVPDETTSTIEFMDMVRGCFSVRGSSPLVVHCSAGVGRTGTYIAIDIASHQLLEDEVVDIFSTVYKMRLNRAFMVQNERQYIFVHEVVNQMVKDYLEKKHSDRPIANVKNQKQKSSDIALEDIYQNQEDASQHCRRPTLDHEEGDNNLNSNEAFDQNFDSVSVDNFDKNTDFTFVNVT